MNYKEVITTLMLVLAIIAFSILGIMRMQVEYKKLQIIELLQQQAMQELKSIKGE